MNKVIVIGCPGSGKSTFARALRDITGLPLYYLDMIWHKPDKTTVTRGEFDSTLAEIVSGEKWIIDGNYQRTLPARLAACDTAFFLDYPLEVCLAGAEMRIGKPREDLPWIEPSFDPEFKQYIVDFFSASRPEIYKLLDKQDKQIHIFKSREQARSYLSNLS